MSGQQILGFYLFEKNILFGDQLYYVHMDEISFHCKNVSLAVVDLSSEN